jgi:VanZ family protein
VGKTEIRVVHVPRWVTVALWILVTAAMVLAIHLLSGHAYRRESSFGDIAAMVYRYDRATSSSSVLLATIAPAVADILFFLPWGALAFLSLDAAERPRKKVYLAVLALGVAFAWALVAWQQWLPTRVTGGIDALWNVVGCAAGAGLAHTRKRVRVRFE